MEAQKESLLRLVDEDDQEQVSKRLSRMKSLQRLRQSDWRALGLKSLVALALLISGYYLQSNRALLNTTESEIASVLSILISKDMS